MSRRVVLSGLLVLALGSLPLYAEAVPIALSLDTTQAAFFQQTQNNPCVIGNPSCNNRRGSGSPCCRSTRRRRR
jgi:hypothetical protein